MLESSGSILQLQSRASQLSNVHLLIVSSQPSSIQAIAVSLTTADLLFSYDTATPQQREESSYPSQYDALIYDYHQTASVLDINFLIDNLQWWGRIVPAVPLILVTDALGDESAIRLIQSGINGYVLRHKLHQLPDILEKSLFDFPVKQPIVQQQQQQIQQLEAEKQAWQEQKHLRQEHISHLVHELRNPIAAIIGFARALKEQYYGELNPKQMQYASLLVGSGEHLLALVKNYLELTKIEANKQVLELERFAVVEICQASILMVEQQAAAKGLELSFELEEQIDFCVADSMRIKQILINLLNNAIKFTAEGSVKLQVTLKDNHLYFAVQDTGVGISAANINKLFRPFPQISNHHESTGLGLTLSKKLAQLHGGDLTVTSKLGQGSCFTLSIPQYQQPAHNN
ncbi:MAG: HAMP domain-containing sensor histidine kinase [Cyanobacteria bacterium J06621_8]